MYFNCLHKKKYISNIFLVKTLLNISLTSFQSLLYAYDKNLNLYHTKITKYDTDNKNSTFYLNLKYIYICNKKLKNSIELQMCNLTTEILRVMQII